ncbi:protein kinase [Streptomyces sp. NPDC048370]|uniref:protein kinase domain-containing protein n=1 Tax=Streptomyces sp. NPDC048370 TaxID=3365540 RepID=UPI003711B270
MSPTGPLTVPEGYRIGDWTVGRTLGSGAFASVYAARRTDLKGRADLPGLPERAALPDLPERAALKFLPTGTHTPRQLRHLRELAEREVELLRRLRSPRLIRLYETLTVDDPDHPELDGATVLVLEEAERPLQALLSGTTPPAAGPLLLVQVCEGLRQLHEAGWVHGDLKPGNVLLMKDGGVRLGDFSTASELEGTHAYAPGFATPDYTPPELLWSDVGDRGMRIRPSSDIWAFGVLVHLVLTGASPLPGGTPTARRDAALRYARGEEELRLSPALPEPWREIVADCLSRTHEERAAHDATSLLPRVREAAAGRLPRGGRTGRRGPLVAAAGALALAVTALGVAFLPDGDPPSTARPGPTTVSSARTTQPTTQRATGYERCAPRSVCFFSAANGGGEVCAWEGDDTDWFDGRTDCSWADTARPRSIFNNGGPDPDGYEYVTYFAQPGLRERLGCVERGRRVDLPPGSPVLSHTWAKTCAV